MRKIRQKKVAATLLCAVLMLGFVSPYDLGMQHFAQDQLSSILQKNNQSWLMALNFFLLGNKELIENNCVYSFREWIPEEKAFQRAIPRIKKICDDIRDRQRSYPVLGESILFNDTTLEIIGDNFVCFVHNEEQFNYRYRRNLVNKSIWELRVSTNSIKIFEKILGKPYISFYYLPKRVVCSGDKRPYDEASRDLTVLLLSMFLDSIRQLDSFTPTQPKLDTSVYQVVDLPLTALIHFELLNPAVFKPQKWPGSTSVGGIAASSPEHALSLLSVRLSAIRPFLPAGLPGESVSDSKRQKRYNRGDGADAPATI